jgi:flagellin
MASVINSNINSLAAQTNLNRSQASLSTSISRLSSGLRVNSSADDAAGYAIAQNFTAQINGTNQAIRNANDGISLAQTAGGALNQTTSDLQRIRQLAVQASNATNSASDRASLQQEVSQLVGDIGSIGNTTQFNGLNILDGSYTGQSFQVGANVGNTISVTVADSRAQSLGSVTAESGAGVATSGLGSSALTGGVVVNGTTIDTSAAANLNDVVAAVNKSSSTTGVTASRALSNSNSVAYTADATNANTLNINGVNVSLAAGTTGSAAADAINTVANQTGVSATFSGGKLQLTSANAGDIKLTDDATNGVLGAVNGGTSVNKGTVTLQAGIVLSGKLGTTITTGEGSSTTGKDLQLLSTSGAAVSAKSYQVSTLDVSTSEGAQKAIQTIDAALKQVASNAAQLGAIQNRFTATVANLQTASTNLSSSRSSIQDADFAAETANLTRAQVLQQAGTAVLAQANQVPNTVLSLLR